MLLGNLFHSPRRLLMIFLVIVLLPSTLLVVFGWQLMQQEERLAAQASREQMADRVVSTLERQLTTVEAQLRDERVHRALPGDNNDSVVVVFNGNDVRTSPEGRLLYYPRAAHVASLSASPSGGRNNRAENAIRDAQKLRTAGNVDAARAALRRAAAEPDVDVAGMPVDLFARWAECDLLEQLGQRGELRDAAVALRADLLDGRWRIGRTVFETHLEDATRWSGVSTLPSSAAAALALSSAIESMWQHWRGLPASEHGTVHRERLGDDERPSIAVWIGDEQRLAAFVAGPALVETDWLGDVRKAAAAQGLSIALREPGRRASALLETRRSETGLPWTVAVAGSPAIDITTSRRFRLWLGGTTVLGLIVIGGAAVITRAAARELAVARLQSDFVAAVSHEFRTPLTSLRQIGEVLQDGRVPSERRSTYYDALVRQTERLHHLVETLLDFGRMEAGRSPYRKEPLDLSAWTRSVVGQFNGEVAPRGFTVELTTHDEPLPVLADAQALANALWNLLDNAVKYSPGCRTVWVAVDRFGDCAAVRVRDRGIGIPADEQRDIFRKFVRGAEATRQNIAGTGIGLAMVQHIMTAHGGSVRVESEPGAGSTFSLEMPCHAS
jgi:signal transduction histidine kinase